MRKTKQTVAPAPDPPEHLSEESKGLWRALCPTRARSVGRQRLLRTALECLDRAEEARRFVETEGLTTKTESTGALHVHPLLRVEKDARGQAMRCWEMLNLTWDASIDGLGKPMEAESC